MDLNQVASNSIEAVREMAQSKALQIRVRLSQPSLWLYADRTRLDQVVMNLLSNAIKYTESGSITISSQKIGGEAELCVKDTGVGIAPELLEQIFEPFRQGTSTWPTSKSGLGLGLAISREIIRMHGGRLWAESDGLSLGSRFRIRLPLANSQAMQQGLQFKWPQAQERAEPLRVLVIEDSEDILALMKFELERLGYSVLMAAQGREGLEVARRDLPDIIISDIKMPDIDGYELIRKIREIPGLASTPAIALTGLGMKRDIEQALSCGYTAHVNKPVDLNELSALIRKPATKQK